MPLQRMALLTILVVVCFDVFMVRDAGLARPGDDYACLWTAGRLALSGRLDGLYEPARFLAEVRALVPGYGGACGWFYPPPTLLLQAPFALLPEALSQGLWLAAGSLALVLVLAGLSGRPGLALAGLAHPASLVNFSLGQNGLFSASLVGLSFGLAGRRPALAGLALGLLAFKPHLFAAALMCLVMSGAFRLLPWALVGALVPLAASLACFGTGPWIDYLHPILMKNGLLDEDMMSFLMQGSVFRTARMAGLAPVACLALQGVAACGGALVARRAGRIADDRRRVGLLAGAMLLILPRFGSYDLAFLAVPALMLASGPPLKYESERAAGVLLWILPALGQSAAAIGLNIVPLLAILLVLALYARPRGFGLSG